MKYCISRSKGFNSLEEKKKYNRDVDGRWMREMRIIRAEGFLVRRRDGFFPRYI